MLDMPNSTFESFRTVLTHVWSEAKEIGEPGSLQNRLDGAFWDELHAKRDYDEGRILNMPLSWTVSG